MYIDKLDDIMGEYNNTYHRKIKMKPIDVKSNTYLNSKKEVNNEDLLNLKLVIMLEFQNTKTFFLKDTLQIGLKKFLLLAKLKIQFLGHMLLMILMVKKLQERFIKKSYRKQTKKNLE